MADDEDPPLGTDDYAEAYARRGDPPPSHEAAAAVDAAKLEAMVTLELRTIWPHALTTHELAPRLGIPWESTTPRMRPLVRKKLAFENGTKRYLKGRPTPSLIWWAANWGVGDPVLRDGDVPPKPKKTDAAAAEVEVESEDETC